VRIVIDFGFAMDLHKETIEGALELLADMINYTHVSAVV